MPPQDLGRQILRRGDAVMRAQAADVSDAHGQSPARNTASAPAISDPSGATSAPDTVQRSMACPRCYSPGIGSGACMSGSRYRMRSGNPPTGIPN